MSELKNAAQIAQELDLTKQAVYTRLKTDTVLQQQLKKYTVKKGRRTYYNEQGQRLIKSQFIRKSNNNTPSNDNQLQFDMSDAAATTMGGAAPALEHKTAEQAKPDKVIDALLTQIEVKDNQIKELQTALHMAQEQQKELSRALTESQEQQAALLSALTAQQALHAGTLQEHFQQQHSAGAETDGTACEHQQEQQPVEDPAHRQQETSTAQPADAATVRTSGAETTASDDQSDAAAATTMGGRSAPAPEEEQPKQTIIEKLKSLFKKQKGTYTMNDFANLQPLQPHTVSGTTKAPDGYKVNPLFVEKRTKRVNLVIQPSTYEKARQRAIKGGFRSFNDYVHTLIENDYNKG